MKKNIFLLSIITTLAASCIGGSGTLGVIKTVDGGSRWQNANLTTGTTNINNLSVAEMAFNPQNHQEIFLTTVSNGLWKSSDSANTWQQILAKVGAYDLFINPQDPYNILVSGIFNQHGKIIRTRDGGATWEEVYNEASVGNSVNSITANPKNPREIYAGLNSGAVLKSSDSGATWVLIKQFPDQLLKIRFNPLNNSLYVLLRSKGLQKSSDYGANWYSISESLTGLLSGLASYIYIAVDTFVKMSLDDQQAGVLYLSTNKGLFKTVDDGVSWSLIKLPILNSAQSSQSSARAVASTHGGMLAYTSVGSTIFKTLDGGKSWQTQSLPTSNLVNKIIIDPQMPQISYAGLIAAQ